MNALAQTVVNSQGLPGLPDKCQIGLMQEQMLLLWSLLQFNCFFLQVP